MCVCIDRFCESLLCKCLLGLLVYERSVICCLVDIEKKKRSPSFNRSLFFNVISEVWSLLLMVCLFSLSFVFSCCFQRLVNWVCDCSISYIKELLWPLQSPWRSNTNMTSWNRMMTTDTIGWQNLCVHTVRPVIF